MPGTIAEQVRHKLTRIGRDGPLIFTHAQATSITAHQPGAKHRGPAWVHPRFCTTLARCPDGTHLHPCGCDSQPPSGGFPRSGSGPPLTAGSLERFTFLSPLQGASRGSASASSSRAVIRSSRSSTRPWAWRSRWFLRYFLTHSRSNAALVGWTYLVSAEVLFQQIL